MAGDRDVVLQMYADFNARDFEAMVFPLAEEVLWAPGVRMTPDEIVAKAEALVAGFSDITYSELEGFSDEEGRVVVIGVLRGTNDGEFGGHSATGKLMRLSICHVLVFDGELCSTRISYGDRLTPLLQLEHPGYQLN